MFLICVQDNSSLLMQQSLKCRLEATEINGFVWVVGCEDFVDVL